MGGLLSKIKQALKPKENKKKKTVKTYTDNPLLKTKKKETSSTKKTAPKSLGGTLPTGKDRLDEVVKKNLNKKTTVKTTDKRTTTKTPTNKSNIKTYTDNPLLKTTKSEDNLAQLRTKRKENKELEKAKKAKSAGNNEMYQKHTQKANEYADQYKQLKQSEKKGYESLTPSEMALYQTLSLTGNPEYVKKGLESAKKTYGDQFKDTQNKIAGQYRYSVDTNPFGQGVIEGTSWIPLKQAQQTIANQRIDSVGDKTGLYRGGEMTGIGLQAAMTAPLAGGEAVTAAFRQGAKSGLKALGRNGLRTAIADIPVNTADAIRQTARKIDEGKAVPESLDGVKLSTEEAEGGVTMKRGTESGMTPDSAEGTTSLNNWNTDLVNQAWDRAEKLGQEPVFGTDKNGMLHYSFSKEGLANILEYYNNAENPTYTLDSTKLQYVNTNLKDFAKTFAIDSALSFGVGSVLGGVGAKQTLGNTKKVAPKTAKEVTEGVASKVDVEPKVKPKTEVKTTAPKVKTAADETVVKNEGKTLPKAETKNTEYKIKQSEFTKNVNKAKEGDTVYKFKDGSEIKLESKVYNGKDGYDNFYTVVKNDGTTVENVLKEDLANTLKSDSAMQTLKPKSDLPKVKETKEVNNITDAINSKGFRNKLDNATEGTVLAKTKEGREIKYAGLDENGNDLFTVVRNGKTEAEEISLQELKKLKNMKLTTKTLPTKSVGADKNRSIPKVKESKSKAAARLEAMGEGKTKYDAETHKGRNEAADTRLETDYEGEIKDLTNTERKMSSEDIATSEKLYQKLIKEGRKTEAKSLMRNVAKQSTEKGQELESLKHIKHNTVEGKIYEGYKTEHKARVAIEKTKRMKTANAEVKKAVDIINNAAKKSKDKDEFVENVTKAIDKILEGRKIKDKVPLRDYIVETAAKVKSLDKSEMDTVIDQVTEEINKRLGIPTLSSEQINKITEYMKNADNAKTLQEKKDWWARADEIIHSLETSTWHDKFRAIQRITMLSNPKTLASRNAGGNLLLRTAETIKEVPATLADMATSKILNTDRTTTLLSAGKYKGQMTGFGQGIKGWGHDLKTGLDTSPTQTHYEYGSVKVFDPAKAKTKGMKVLYKSLDFLDGTIRKGLQLGDRPFYQSAYNGRVAELTTLVNKGKAKLTEKEIEESARMYALDQVFQGDTAIARRASELRRSMRIFGDILIPFTQTPANILDKLVDYSPVGFARDIYRLGVRRATGEFDQKQFVDTLGRAFTGSGVIMLGYALAKKGLLTTDIYQQSETAEEYKLRTLLGEQSYSLITNAEFDDKGNLTGGTYHSINWMSPVGSMLLMGADFYNGVEGSEEELLGALYRGFQTAVDGVFAQSFLSGVTDLIASNQYNSNTKSSGAAQKITDTLISQFTGQLSMNLLASTTRVIDPYKRETYDPNKLKKAFNTWKSKNPLLSRTLPVKIGVDGKPIKQYQGRGKLSKMWESFLNPFNKSAHQSDAVNAEVLNVYNQTGSDSVLLNSMSNGKFTYNDTDFVIKSGDWLSRYQKTMGEYATTEIQKLMDKKSWQGLSYGEKAEKIAAINTKAEKIAIEDYLVSSGEMTQEQFDYTTLNKKQKGQVDSGIITATEIRKISDNVKAKGADKDTTQISELLQMGYSSKKIKQLGYDTKLTGKNGRGVTSYARAVKLADAGVNTKIYNKVTKVENVDTSGDGYASHEEVKTYIEKYYPKMSYEEKLAIMYARFGAKYY